MLNVGLFISQIIQNKMNHHRTLPLFYPQLNNDYEKAKVNAIVFMIRCIILLYICREKGRT